MKFDARKLFTNLASAGTEVTKTLLQYQVMKDMSRCNMSQSIWGGMGFGCGYGGGYGIGYPMMGGMGLGGYDMGIQMAAAEGYQIGQMMRAELIQSGELKADNKKASAVSANHDTSKGEAFEKASHELVDKEGKAVENKVFSFMSDAWKKLQKKDNKTDTENKQMTEEYRKSLSDMGKSYIMTMDKSKGNKDGYVTEEEFVEYSIAKDFPALKEDATKEEKAEYKEKLEQAKVMARAAYQKLDQNGDKALDWKEAAALFAAADNGSSGLNGQIESEDFEKLSEQLSSSQTNELDAEVRKRYIQLFGQNQQ